MRANDCGECRQPLEEWEAGLCEECQRENQTMSLESKLRYVNQVIDECNAVIRDAKACKKVLSMLPKEVKDLTEHDCNKIAVALPTRCIGNVQRKTPRFDID